MDIGHSDTLCNCCCLRYCGLVLNCVAMSKPSTHDALQSSTYEAAEQGMHNKSGTHTKGGMYVRQFIPVLSCRNALLLCAIQDDSRVNAAIGFSITNDCFSGPMFQLDSLALFSCMYMLRREKAGASSQDVGKPEQLLATENLVG